MVGMKKAVGPDPAHGSWFWSIGGSAASGHLEMGTDLPRTPAPVGGVTRRMKRSFHMLADSFRNSVFMTGFKVREVENPALRTM